jgi:hypothetical protein
MFGSLETLYFSATLECGFFQSCDCFRREATPKELEIHVRIQHSSRNSSSWQQIWHKLGEGNQES